MAEIDTERENYTQLMQSPESFDFAADAGASDHDLLIHHVAQHDHELYGLDCCLSEMFGA